MNVLAFDTCYAALSVAVGRDRGGGIETIMSERIRLETGHAEALMPLIERTMRSAEIDFSNLDGIVVTSGPGTFTGVRTGVAAARALALATRTRLVGVSSLWALAVMTRPGLENLDATSDAMLVAMDARKSEVHVQTFDIEGRALDKPQLLDLDAAAALLPGRRLHLIGSAAPLLAGRLDATGRRYVLALDCDTLAVHHRTCEAAAILPAANNETLSGPLQPLYLRPPDAKPQSGKSLPWVST